MSHLKYLVEQFDEADESELGTRVALALDMIEFVVSYPQSEICDDEEISSVTKRVHLVTTALEAKGQHLFADRICKIWRKRNHLLMIAENAYHLRGDYMDDLEYHEEIKWIRDQKCTASQVLC